MVSKDEAKKLLELSTNEGVEQKKQVVELFKVASEQLQIAVRGELIHEGLPVVVDMSRWGRRIENEYHVCAAGLTFLYAYDEVLEDLSLEPTEGMCLINLFRWPRHWKVFREKGFTLPNVDKYGVYTVLKTEEILEALKEFVSLNS